MVDFRDAVDDDEEHFGSRHRPRRSQMTVTTRARMTETTMSRRHMPPWLKIMIALVAVVIIGTLAGSVLAAILIAG